jgi:hypothetical protein
MAKLGKRKISVSSSIDHTQRLGFEVEVNVSKDGQFYFSLDADQMKTLLDYGVDLSNTFNRHTKKLGTFYADTLEKLEKNFQNLLEEAISGEIIEDKFVILYRIRTACSYCMGGGIPVPNGYYVPKEESPGNGYANWIEGTDKGEGAFGFNVYAQVYHKQIIRFKSGQEKLFYWFVNYQKIEKLGEYGKRLNAFTLKAFDIRDANKNNWDGFGMDGRKEIAYTEENAKFFCDLLTAICKMNEQIKGFIKEPELLQQIINQQVKLLQ